MKVILLENVEGVGRTGETRDVRDGYGRNFLVPRGLALPATKGNLKKMQDRAKTLIDKRERTVKASELLKQKLEESSLALKKKSGIDGKLFGSVTSKEIVEAVKDRLQMDLDRRSIRLEEPIKMIGSYTVEVHLEKGVDAQLRIEIEEE